MSDSGHSTSLFGELRFDQRLRWLRGERTLVEHYLAEHSELAADAESLLDFIYSEYCLREELGDSPRPESYFERFPQYVEQLKPLFEIHAAVSPEPSIPSPGAGEPPPEHSGVDSVNIANHDTLKSASDEDDLPRPARPPMASAAQSAADSIPQSIDRYRILSHIGAGGMGHVFKAEDQLMKRVVALKVLARTAVLTPEAVRRFYREVEMAARLSHPHIVTAYDAGQQQGSPYLVMEYVDGIDLSEFMKRHGALPIEQAVDFVVQAARGLEYAHAEGLVHRDIKPGNLLVEKRGNLKILDMGLARLDNPLGAGEAGVADGLTATGQIIGTVAYMSPEQAEDTRRADARADIYSLGCTLYHLLTGRPPYSGDTIVKILWAHRQSPVPSPKSLRPEIPAELEQVCLRMMAKQPADRLASMTEVIAALAACVHGVEPGSSGSGRDRLPRVMSLPVPSQAAEAGPTDVTQAAPPRGVSDVALAPDSGASQVTRAGDRAETTSPPSRSSRGWLMGASIASLLAIAAVVGLTRKYWRPWLTPQPAASTTDPRDRAKTKSLADPRRSEPLPGFVLAPSPMPGARRWQIETVRPRFASARPQRLAFSADEKRLAVADGAGAVRVYDVPALRLARVLPGWYHQLAWSPDGQWLAIAAAPPDAGVDLWNTSTWTMDRALDASATPTALAWSGDSRRIAAGCDRAQGAVCIWNLRDASQPLRIDAGAACQSLAWNPSPEHQDDLLVGLLASHAIFDASSGKLLHDFRLPVRSSYSVYSPDGSRIASAPAPWLLEFPVLITNAATGSLVSSLGGLQSHANQIDWGPDRRLAVAGDDGGKICNLAAGDVVGWPRGQTSPLASVAWSPRGTWIAGCSTLGELTLADGRDDRTAQTVHPLKGYWIAGAPSPDGRHVAVGSLGQGSARIWNLADGMSAPAAALSKSEIRCAAWNPAGTWLATGSSQSAARLVSAQGQAGAVLDGQTGGTRALAWSADGSHLATLSAKGAIQVQRLSPTGAEVVGANDSLAGVSAIAITFDGSRVAVAAASALDKSIYLFDPASAAPPRKLATDAAINDLAYSADGRWLVVRSGGRRTARIYSIAEGQRGPVFQSAGGGAVVAAWSPAGAVLAVAGSDQDEILWRADPDSPTWIGFGPKLRSTRLVAWSPDGSQLAIARDANDPPPDHVPAPRAPTIGRAQLLLLDIDDLAVKPAIAMTVRCTSIAWDRENHALAIAGEDRVVRRYDATSGEPLSSAVPLGGISQEAAIFSAAGQLLNADPSVERQLIYVVDREKSGLHALGPEEFHKR